MHIRTFVGNELHTENRSDLPQENKCFSAQKHVKIQSLEGKKLSLLQHQTNSKDFTTPQLIFQIHKDAAGYALAS